MIKKQLALGFAIGLTVMMLAVTGVQEAKNPLAKFLLFPQVTRGKNTRLEKLTESEALLECLRQSPKEYPASILGQSALEGQFEIYSRLVKSRRSYRLHLGADQQQLRAVLASL